MVYIAALSQQMIVSISVAQYDILFLNEVVGVTISLQRVVYLGF